MYEQQEQQSLMQLRHELGAMQNILHRQYEQYKMSKDNIDTLNRKYHDMKYQITAIRNESSPEIRDKYLEEMESGIKVYEAQNKTGNSVLDTVLTGKSLYCIKHGITLTCMAEGTLLNFMNVIDICTIFGNALDNAIEYVEKISDEGKRLINLAVYAKGELLLLRFENYLRRYAEL
jgi:sensor histidine kinase regulating citrate/malate metabolism